MSPMPPRVRLLYSTMCVALFFVAAMPLFAEFSRQSDIWWTPQAMLVPLTESADRVEVYVRGRPLATLLQRRQIQIAEDSRADVLTPGEVGVRFNNWDRVRAGRLPLLLVSAASSGVAALMFLLLLTGRLVYRDEKRVAA